MPRVLLLNDYPGYQRVALAAQAPILESRGVEVFRLPTALLSNTLNYREVARLDTTDYIRETLKVWENLGFRFDAIVTGFMNSSQQCRVILEYCREQRHRGAALFCDPVMADNGRLYSTIPPERVEELREFAALSDFMTPNYTESCLLTGIPWKPEITRKEARELLDGLRKLGSKNPVITSVPFSGIKDRAESDPKTGEYEAGYGVKTDAKTGECAVVGYDGETGEYVEELFTPIPISYYGTGDCFMAFFLDASLRGKDIRHSIRDAMRGVEGLLRSQASHLV